MFKEKRNRSLKVGDLILHGLAYGVILSENSYLDEYFTVRKFKKSETILCYLIEHPDEYEQQIKEGISEHFNNIFSSDLMKKSNNMDNKSTYSLGDILEDKDGKYYVYLGNICIRTVDCAKYNLSGHGYLRIPDYFDRLHCKVLDEASVLSYISQLFTNGRLRIKSSDIEYSTNEGYNLQLSKKKSTRFESVVSHIDISSLNYSTFNYDEIDRNAPRKSTLYVKYITHTFHLTLLDLVGVGPA